MTREQAQQLRRPPSEPPETQFPLLILGQGDYRRAYYDCFPDRAVGVTASVRGSTPSGADARPGGVFLWILAAAIVWLMLAVAVWRLT